MNSKVILVASLLALTGCDDTARQLEADAHACAGAVRSGQLGRAEELCRSALGDPARDILSPSIRSQRLYELARIERQLSKFKEAGRLLDESLAIEMTLTGDRGVMTARRKIELSLVLAGQGQWQHGAVMLEESLPSATQLTAQERASLRNIVRHYVTRLKGDQQVELAARLDGLAAQQLADR